MRGALTLALVLAACGNDNTTPGGDLAMTLDDLSTSGTADLSGIGSDAGGPGSPCQTACDCMAGLGCVANVCTNDMQGIFCCESPDCPNGELCQHMTGMFALCGGPPIPDGGVPDGGNAMFCTAVNCRVGGDARCTMFGCGPCADAPGPGNKRFCTAM